MNDNVDLKFLRKKIETCDLRILSLLEERLELVEHVANTKKIENIPFRDFKREESIINNLIKNKRGLNPELIKNIYTLIFEENAKNKM